MLNRRDFLKIATSVIGMLGLRPWARLFDLPAVGWILLFVGSAVTVHSTYWHSNYGVPTSRGCVNASPEDAKWVFRWTLPQVPYDPGDVTISIPGGTLIEVVET